MQQQGANFSFAWNWLVPSRTLLNLFVLGGAKGCLSMSRGAQQTLIENGGFDGAPGDHCQLS